MPKKKKAKPPQEEEEEEARREEHNGCTEKAFHWYRQALMRINYGRRLLGYSPIPEAKARADWQAFPGCQYPYQADVFDRVWAAVSGPDTGNIPDFRSGEGAVPPLRPPRKRLARKRPALAAADDGRRKKCRRSLLHPPSPHPCPSPSPPGPDSAADPVPRRPRRKRKRPRSPPPALPLPAAVAEHAAAVVGCGEVGVAAAGGGRPPAPGLVSMVADDNRLGAVSIAGPGDEDEPAAKEPHCPPLHVTIAAAARAAVDAAVAAARVAAPSPPSPTPPTPTPPSPPPFLAPAPPTPPSLPSCSQSDAAPPPDVPSSAEEEGEAHRSTPPVSFQSAEDEPSWERPDGLGGRAGDQAPSTTQSGVGPNAGDQTQPAPTTTDRPAPLWPAAAGEGGGGTSAGELGGTAKAAEGCDGAARRGPEDQPPDAPKASAQPAASATPGRRLRFGAVFDVWPSEADDHRLDACRPAVVELSHCAAEVMCGAGTNSPVAGAECIAAEERAADGTACPKSHGPALCSVPSATPAIPRPSAASLAGVSSEPPCHAGLALPEMARQRDARPQPAASCAGDAAADAFHPSGAVLATAATEVDDPSPGIHDGEAVSGANADGPHPHVIAIQNEPILAVSPQAVVVAEGEDMFLFAEESSFGEEQVAGAGSIDVLGLGYGSGDSPGLTGAPPPPLPEAGWEQFEAVLEQQLRNLPATPPHRDMDAELTDPPALTVPALRIPLRVGSASAVASSPVEDDPGPDQCVEKPEAVATIGCFPQLILPCAVGAGDNPSTAMVNPPRDRSETAIERSPDPDTDNKINPVENETESSDTPEPVTRRTRSRCHVPDTQDFLHGFNFWDPALRHKAACQAETACELQTASIHKDEILGSHRRGCKQKSKGRRVQPRSDPAKSERHGPPSRLDKHAWLALRYFAIMDGEAEPGGAPQHHHRDQCQSSTDSSDEMGMATPHGLPHGGPPALAPRPATDVLGPTFVPVSKELPSDGDVAEVFAAKDATGCINMPDGECQQPARVAEPRPIAVSGGPPRRPPCTAVGDSEDGVCGPDSSRVRFPAFHFETT